MQSATPVSPFRKNTCKSVSKQMTLTAFRINTYEKQGGGGTVPNLPGTFSLTLCLCASVANPVFSAVCPLFVVSLRSFPHSLPLFSIDCSLFLQNTGVGYPECHYGTRGWGWVATQSLYCSGIRLESPAPGAIFPIRSVLKIAGQNSLSTLPPAITAI